MRAHLGLVGGGPAEILLSHLSHSLGVESMVFEPKSHQEVKAAFKAGVLADATAKLPRETDVGERVDQEELLHEEVILRVRAMRDLDRQEWHTFSTLL